MTTYYVDSAAGSNTAPYDTWAKAATSIATIYAIDAAGDTVYVASTHNDATTPLSLNWAGTATSPTRVICADKTSGAPPTTPATGGTIGAAFVTTNTTGTAFVYYYGLKFKASDTSSGTALKTIGNPNAVGFTFLESCALELSSVGVGTVEMDLGGGVFYNCTMKFDATSQRCNCDGGPMSWIGGSLLATSPTTLGSNTSGGLEGVFENFDLSAASASVNLLSQTSGRPITFRNCKMPTSWSGSLNTGSPSANGVNLLSIADSAGTNYVLQRKTPFGTVSSETVLVRSGGASDGTTALSWKMVSVAASGLYPIAALQTGEFVIWNDTSGSSKTVTVEYLHDSVTGLKNNEIWLEVRYYGVSGNPLGSLASSAPADILATATTNTSSSTTWTTTGITNVNKQKMSVTFTPQLKGLFIATVKLAKASYTVYVDALMTVT